MIRIGVDYRKTGSRSGMPRKVRLDRYERVHDRKTSVSVRLSRPIAECSTCRTAQKSDSWVSGNQNYESEGLYQPGVAGIQSEKRTSDGPCRSQRERNQRRAFAAV